MCNSAALVEALDEALILLADARDALAADPADLSYLADAGYRSRTRLDARSGAHRTPSPPSRFPRPVLRLKPGAYGWVSTLKQAESLGGRIEVY